MRHDWTAVLVKLAALGAAALVVSAGRAQPSQPAKLFVAHRGGALWPENSLLPDLELPHWGTPTERFRPAVHRFHTSNHRAPLPTTTWPVDNSR